jgi:hypothetical protein
MREKIHERVSVVCYYDHKKGKFLPHRIYWKSRDYTVGEIGFPHKYRNGDTWYHIFEVVDKEQSLAFRLNFNSKDLNWTLEVVSDGLAS